MQKSTITKLQKFDVDLGPTQQVAKLSLLDRDVTIANMLVDTL